ncbi:MAG: CDP-archaeol synthase [Deltaproteobacteria bacterium]|nr:CDP-archaeol synthase [Deltaproteobacteria bacterium]
MQTNLSNLSTRTITAVALISILSAVLLLSSIFCFGRWLALACAVVIVGMSAFEFACVCTAQSKNVTKRLTYFLILMVPAAAFLSLVSVTGLCDVPKVKAAMLSCVVNGTVLISLLGAVLYVIAAGARELEHSIEIAREIFVGIVLISLGGASLLSLLLFEDLVRLVAWLVAVVSINDTCAYLFGSKVGGPRLAPLISPNKTISGSAAGLICGVAAGQLLAFLLPIQRPALEIIIVSLFVVVAAQLGDLSKSFIKRMNGVKDSGTLLPGHGGVLDRADGILAAAPPVLFYYLVTLIL